MIYAPTRTHISENFPAPNCTKIAAPARVRVRAHARTLKVWTLLNKMSSLISLHDKDKIMLRILVTFHCQALFLDLVLENLLKTIAFT